MSRHSKFYSDLKRGGGDYDDDYDDYDDYDEEEYDDDHEPAYAVAKSQAAKAAPPSKSSSASAARPTAASSPKVDRFEIDPSAPDYDLLTMLVASLRDVVGPSISTERLISVIRECNYDPDAAAGQLTGSPTSPPRVNSTASPRSDSSTVDRALVEKRKGGAKTLKLGGSGGSAPSAQPSGKTAVASSNFTPQHSDPAVSSSIALPTAAAPVPSVVSASSAAAAASPPATSFGEAKPAVDAEGKHACTVIVAGHVDSGKSTILGHTLLLLGHYTERDVQRNESQGRASGKGSFKYAWLLDQSEEERRRGVTIDAGSHGFETEHKRVHVLDAPGHKDFVMSMITSATLADLAILVVPASTGEFESGLQHGTKEHLTVLHTLGVGKLIIAVNKMDTVSYSKDRFDYIAQELRYLLNQTRFSEDDVLCICPVCGVGGVNLVTKDTTNKMPWYDGPTLVEAIDSAPNHNRLLDGPLRVTLQDVQKQTLYCHIEVGRVKKGDTVHFVPCGVKVVVKGMDKLAAGPVTHAAAGDTVEITTNSDLTGLYAGCVGCSPKSILQPATEFECHIQTLPALTNAIMPGSHFVLAIHSLSVSVRVSCLIAKMDKSGNWSTGMVKCIPAGSQGLVVLQVDAPIAVEPAETVRALGRFVLRQNGETVGGGVVRRVMPAR